MPPQPRTRSKLGQHPAEPRKPDETESADTEQTTHSDSQQEASNAPEPPPATPVSGQEPMTTETKPAQTEKSTALESHESAGSDSDQATQAAQQLFTAPDVSTRITTSNIRKETLGLRVPAEINDWWKRWGKLQQAIHDIPDGVLPEIAAQIIIEQQDEIIRRAVAWKHSQ